MRIIVGASLAKYFGLPGRVDHRLAYVLGLQRLGHEVYVVDDLGSKPLAGEDGDQMPLASWPGTKRFEILARRYGLWPDCALIHGNERSTHGLPYAELLRLAETADLLLNIQGKIEDPEILGRVRVRAYVDGAPGHTQVYESVYRIDQRVGGHDVHFTYGLNIGTSRSDIPDCGVEWHALLPPVVLAQWRPQAPAARGRFTTISKWARDPTFALNGRYSGRKFDNWRKFSHLPQRTRQPLEIALNIDPAYASDIRTLEENGWVVSDPRQLRTLPDYIEYIGGSLGEFSVANSRYVDFSTGWFSERSARYLAAGRPVVVQSTGIESHLPVGNGILTFASVDEAADALDAVAADYPMHSTAAREIAEEFFDSDKVLGGLLERAGVAT